MRRSRPAALALALVFAAAAGAAGPRLEVAEDRRWILTDLPPILADDAVRKHLTTGLTTSFDFRLGPRRQQGGGMPAARILVRYELWDEAFLVTAVAGGPVEQRTVASFDELLAWWRDLRLEVEAAAPAGGSTVPLTVDVAPFSRAERDDAQAWLSRSLDRAGRSPAEELERSADEGAGRLAEVLHLLLATAIERRPLASYRFTLERPEDPR